MRFTTPRQIKSCATVLLLLLLSASSRLAAAAETQIRLTSNPYTSLDGGVTQTPVPTDIVSHANGTTTATQKGSQSDFFTFGPDLNQAFAGVAEVDTRASAEFGKIRLQTYAAASASPTLYGPPFVIGTNPYDAVARTSIQAYFTDAVTVTHPTLPAGAAAKFQFNLVVDSSVFGNSQAILQYTVGLTAGFFSRGQGIQFGFPDHFVLSFPVDTVVGETLPVHVLLGSGGQARAGYNVGRGFEATGFDAFNTATLNLDPITPGLGIGSESGHRYATIPEPSAVCGAVALLLFALRGRGSRSRRSGGRNGV